jgi:hypothetical protein
VTSAPQLLRVRSLSRQVSSQLVACICWTEGVGISGWLGQNELAHIDPAVPEAG